MPVIILHMCPIKINYIALNIILSFKLFLRLLFLKSNVNGSHKTSAQDEDPFDPQNFGPLDPDPQKYPNPRMPSTRKNLSFKTQISIINK